MILSWINFEWNLPYSYHYTDKSQKIKGLTSKKGDYHEKIFG